VAGAIGGCVAYFFFLREQVLEVTTVRLTRGHVEQTITAIASGTVKPATDSMVASSFMGKVAAIPVDEGDRVEAGDLLVELEHVDLDAQVALTEANLRVGLSRLDQAKIVARIYQEIARTRVSQAAAQLEVAQLDHDRFEALSQKKAVSQSDFDRITMLLRVARENDAAAKAAQQENLVRTEDIRSAEALVEQLEAALAVAKETREKAFVRAPFAGMVAEVSVDIGEAVGAGLPSMAGLGGAGAGAGAGIAASVPTASTVPLIRLIEDTDLYVEAPFDEADAADIKAGQKVRVNLDAYRGVDFPGTVTFVSPVVTANLDRSRTLDVRVRIDEGKDKFVIGMSADVTIIAQEKEDVLYVPSEALIRDEQAYVVEDSRAVKRDVKVGIGDWRSREVLDGLTEGEELITSIVLKDLEDGIKVRAVDTLSRP